MVQIIKSLASTRDLQHAPRSALQNSKSLKNHVILSLFIISLSVVVVKPESGF